MQIYCCECKNKIEARLTNGLEIYPHRSDLASLPFWKCDRCRNFVGCHYKTKDPTKPLGCIPNKAIKEARQHIHKLLDPLWHHNKKRRDELYNLIAKKTGRASYHTANIRSVEEAREIYKIILDIKNGK
jgi:hypothetical protein